MGNIRRRPWEYRLKMRTITMKSELHNILLIFCIAFFIRLFFALNDNNILFGDEIFYENTGANIMLGSGYSYGGHLIVEKPPGYPVFISLVYSIFGRSFIPVRIIQAVMDALMCIVLYAITRRLFDEKVAILSGILCSMHYFFLKSLQLIRPDTLQMFFIVISVFYWIKWREKFSKIDAALLGIFSSISVMLKANMAMLSFLIILIELFRVIKNKQERLDIFIKSALIFVLLFSFPIAIWTVRNYKVFNTFIPLATDSGLALYSSYNPPEGKKFGILSDDSVTKKAQNIVSEVERSRYLTAKTVERIITHPKEIIRLIPLKILFFWSVFDWETLGDGQGTYNFSTAFILPFSILGLIFLRSRFSYFYPITVPIIYVFILGIVFIGLPRFRLAIEPFLIILAAFSIVHFYNKYSKRLVILLSILWFCINFYIFTNSSGIFFIGKSMLQYLKLW